MCSPFLQSPGMPSFQIPAVPTVHLSSQLPAPASEPHSVSARGAVGQKEADAGRGTPQT